MKNVMMRNRWVFVLTMFLFLLFHQFGRFLIEPITLSFRAISSVTDVWFDTQLPIDILIGIAFLPVWGFLFDRHSRKRLLSLAGFIWVVSAWLMGIAPTFATFNVSRAFSGISNASYSGIYAMVGDLFKPNNRGKILALLLLAQPLAIVMGIFLPNILIAAFGWRNLLFLFGVVGFGLALAIHFLIIEPKRGATEPAFINIQMTSRYQFDWDLAKTTLLKPSLVMIYAIVFFGTVPVAILLDGLLIYLRDVHGLQTLNIYVNIFPSMLGLTLGYPFGGYLGDFLFKYQKKGRMIASLFGLVFPIISLYLAFRAPDVQGQQFLVGIFLMSFFMAFTLPNLFASIMDITLPEMRSSACAFGLFFQGISILVSPMILSFSQSYIGIGDAILWICIGAWSICVIILAVLFVHIPLDIEELRRHMAYRGQLEARLKQSKGS